MNSIITEIMGWSGSICILAAYALISFQRIDSKRIPYHLMNVIGAFLLASYGYLKEASATIFLNGVWLVIGLITMYAIYSRRNANPS